MASSLTLNGTTSANSPNSIGLSMDESEESFVVLSGGADSDDGNLLSVQSSMVASSTSSMLYPAMPQVPVTDSVSQSMLTSVVSSTSELSAEEIQQKLESLLHENIQLKETLNQNNLAMKKQFSTLVMWQEDVMKVHQSHKEKFEETKKLIANLRAENAELKKSVSLPTSITAPGEEAINLKAKISALEFELDTLRQANIKHKSEQSKIIQELEMKLSETEKSKHEELTQCKNQIESLNIQLQEVEKQYNKIKEELDEAKTKIPTRDEIIANENAKAQLKELAEELLLKNKMLLEKTELTDNLHVEISKLKIENETIPILKTQVELYQSDFNQEREARNTLKAEKDRIADDLQHLQRRNQKLLEQVEKLQRDAQTNLSSSQSASRSSPVRNAASREQTPPTALYSCPVCENKYRTMRILEDHIEICLQNSS